MKKKSKSGLHGSGEAAEKLEELHEQRVPEEITRFDIESDLDIDLSDPKDRLALGLAPFDLDLDENLNRWGVPCTFSYLKNVAGGTALAQSRWMTKHVGDTAVAGAKLAAVLDACGWRPQDLAHALGTNGHKVRTYTRGESAFDAAFLVQTFSALEHKGPKEAAAWFLELEELREGTNTSPDVQDEEMAAFPGQPLWKQSEGRISDAEKQFVKDKPLQTRLPGKDVEAGWWTDFKSKPIPLYGKAAAGLGEDISDVSRMIDVVDSPSACKGPDCYAVFISGDSMEPAMRSGMVAYVAPSLPVRARDFVVVQMLPKASADGKPQTAVIKEYKSIVEEEDGAKSVRVRQYNPPLDMKLKNVDQIHRVVAVEFV